MSRAAGVDLGRVRVGLAIADELGMLAHPRPCLDGRNPNLVLRALKQLCTTDGVDTFVVGLPMSLSGAEGLQARRARAFAERLGLATGAKVELLDERLTTVQARLRLKEQGLNERQTRTRIDSAAAAVLLQHWLDMQRREALP